MRGCPARVRSKPCEKGPSYQATGRERAVEVRPFTAKTRLYASEGQGLSGEAVKGNPTTTVIPRVGESKTTPEELSEPNRRGPQEAEGDRTGVLLRYCSNPKQE